MENKIKERFEERFEEIINLYGIDNLFDYIPNKDGTPSKNRRIYSAIHNLIIEIVESAIKSPKSWRSFKKQ
jgi:hypothetical protein